MGSHEFVFKVGEGVVVRNSGGGHLFGDHGSVHVGQVQPVHRVGCGLVAMGGKT